MSSSSINPGNPGGLFIYEDPPEKPILQLAPPAEMPKIEFRPYDINTFFEALPEDIQDTLLREAYLARAAEILIEGQEENKSKQNKIASAKPALMAFRPNAKREFLFNIERANNEIDFFTKALTLNEQVMKNLRKFARRQLEVWLREHDTTYMHGLACEQFISDWKNAVNLVSSIMVDFIKAIGDARNMMTSGYNSETKEYSPQALESLNRAVKVGFALESDTASVNAVAQKHDDLFRGTIYENPFPRLPIFAAEGHTANAKLKPIGLLQKHFDRIKGYYTELSDEGIPALNQSIAKAEERKVSVQNSYMITLWEGLRLEAKKHVEEERLEEVVKDTEKNFLHGDYA